MGLILVIPGAEIRLAGFQVFNLGIRGPEGVDAIVGRDLCEFFTSAALGFVFIGLTVSAWLLPRGAAPKPLVIGLPPFLLMPELPSG